MGSGGRIRRKAEVDRVAAKFGVPWKAVEVWCYGDHGYRVYLRSEPAVYVLRDTLQPAAEERLYFSLRGLNP